tara:strand:- start:193 stop:369 length:177 start_codon:yes stop_codon:yes gene_type:complete
MILVGLVVGFILGRKAGIGYILAKNEQEQRRADRRKKRAEVSAAKEVETAAPDESTTG